MPYHFCISQYNIMQKIKILTKKKQQEIMNKYSLGVGPSGLAGYGVVLVIRGLSVRTLDLLEKLGDFHHNHALQSSML